MKTSHLLLAALLALLGVATARAQSMLIGEAVVQKDIALSSYTPSATTAKLYQIGGTLYWSGTAIAPAGPAGTVTSFAAGDLAPIFTSAVATGTTTPALTFTLTSQSPNKVLAGPASGSSAAPSFRSLVAADVPALSYASSVGLTAPAEFAVTGSPVTSAGTLALSWATNVTANSVIASPNGTVGAPSARHLVTADLPVTVLGSMFYGGAAGAPATLAGNTSTAQRFLAQTGDGVNSAAPSWQPLPSAGLLTYYLAGTASDVSGYKKQLTTPFTPKTTLPFASLNAGNHTLENWVTEPGFPGLTFIPAGQFEFHVHASKTAGTRSAVVFAEIWECNAAGVDIAKIGTTESSAALTGSESEYRLFFTTANVYNLASSSSRIVCRVIATVGASGSDATVNLIYGDEADSHIALPSNTVDATNFVPYLGSTSDLNLGAHSLFVGNDTDPTRSDSGTAPMLGSIGALNQIYNKVSAPPSAIYSFGLSVRNDLAAGADWYHYSGAINGVMLTGVDDPGNYNEFYGVQGIAGHRGSATVDDLFGLSGLAINYGSGGISHGASSALHGLGAGTANFGAGTVNNADGVTILSPAGTGPMTNVVGLRIRDQTYSGATAWQLYSEGNKPSYFAGTVQAPRVGIGTAADSVCALRTSGTDNTTSGYTFAFGAVNLTCYPIASLDVSTVTAATDTTNQHFHHLIVNPAAALSKGVVGNQVFVTVPSTATYGSSNTLYGNLFQIYNFGQAGFSNQYGSYVVAVNQGTATSGNNNLIGSFILAGTANNGTNQTTAVGTIYGSQINVSNGSTNGTTGTIYGQKILAANSGTVSTAGYGLYISGFGTGGTWTNPAYDIYCADAGAGNYFAGTVSVANTTDATAYNAASVVLSGGLGVAGKIIGNSTAQFTGLTLSTTADPVTLASWNDGGQATALLVSGQAGKTDHRLRIYNNLAVSTSNDAALDLALNTTVQGRGAFLIRTFFSDTTDATRTSYATFGTAMTGTFAERARFSSAGNFLIGTTADTGLTGPGGLSVGNTTDATAYNAASVVLAGGLGVAGKIITNSTVTFGGYGAGTATFDASGNISSSSDERLKDVQGKFTRGLADVAAIQPITYKWKPSSGMETAGTYSGFSAQNVLQAVPEAVGMNRDGMLTLDDRPVLAAAINSINELNTRLTAAEKVIAALAKDNAALRSQLAQVASKPVDRAGRAAARLALLSAQLEARKAAEAAAAQAARRPATTPAKPK